MSKSKTTQEPAEAQQPAYVDELLVNGTVVLTTASREALAEQIDAIPAKTRYAAGVIGRNPETGTFALRLDLIK